MHRSYVNWVSAIAAILAIEMHPQISARHGLVPQHKIKNIKKAAECVDFHGLFMEEVLKYEYFTTKSPAIIKTNTINSILEPK